MSRASVVGVMIAIPITAFLIGTLGFDLRRSAQTRNALRKHRGWASVGSLCLLLCFGSKEGIASDETGSHNGKTKLNEEDPGNGGKVLK